MDRRRVAGALRRLAVAALALLPVGEAPAAAGSGGAPLVAAASDLQFALTEIAALFEKEGGGRIETVFGSSGNLARQIRQGAPFQMFFSADESYVLALARDGFARNSGRVYARGRIALVLPEGSPLRADESLSDLRAALADGRLKRFAIADPQHAPYGRAAEEALRKQGLWEAVRPRLVLGENVSQAARFALSGDAQGGIIAYSLALSPALAGRGAHVLLPEDWHAPLVQRMVLLPRAGPVAEAFFAFLGGPAAREALRRHGFVPPDDAS